MIFFKTLSELTICYYHVMYTFQSESTLYSCLNIKELLAWNWHDIWSLRSSNAMWPHNHLVRKWTLNHLAKLAKWLSCVASIYLYGAFDCMLLSCHVHISEWIKELLEIQATIDCRFTLKSVSDMIIRYNQMLHTEKYSQHSSIIWPVWLNGWMFVYELSGCGFESCCCHLYFRYGACFKQGVPWHSSNYRV